MKKHVYPGKRTERIILAVGLVAALLASVLLYGPVRIRVRWDAAGRMLDVEVSCSAPR